MVDTSDASIILDTPFSASASLLDACPAIVGPEMDTMGASNHCMLQKRSLSCSALSDDYIAAVQEVHVAADDSSVHSGETDLSVASAATCDLPLSSEGAAAPEPATEAESCHKHRHHKHKHKHKHHDRVTGLSAHERSRSVSAEDLPSVQLKSYGSGPNLVGLAEQKHPKSFTAPTRLSQPHQFLSAPGLTTKAANAAGPNPAHGSTNRHTHRHSANGTVPMAHVVVAGRRSPLVGVKQQGLGVGVGGGYGAAGLGIRMLPKPDKIIAEFQKPEDIAKGFAAQWFSRRILDVFTGSQTAAPASQLLAQVPTCAGLHLWVVRPPRSKQWVPVHLGSADHLQQALRQYIHTDGSCGPAGEPFKHKVMVDLMCRGFAVQVRFRPLKPGLVSAKEDELSKLRLYDFPLNDKDNGGCRPIELPNGWQVVEYPVVNDTINKLFEGRFGPRRML